MRKGLVFDLASRYDASQTTRKKRGLKQRLPQIRDQFTISELVEKSGGREIPGKFVSFDTEGTQVFVALLHGRSR
jgi:hypothetical protein